MINFSADAALGLSRELRVLSISGGGLLGVIPAAFLMHYEALGQSVYGSDYRLSDSFDLVGGSSTGAVIATGVALGLPATEIANFYLRDVPQGFRRRRGSVPLLHDLFDGDLMQGFFARRTGARCLEREALACDLAITVKNLNASKPMVFSTLPGEASDMGDVDHRRDPLPLDLLLRASTAAPGLFSPVPLTLENGEEILAADGGVSMFNDPSLLLARLAWDGGADRVDLTALGTGSTRPVHHSSRLSRGPSVMRALKALLGVIKDGEAQTRNLLAALAANSATPLKYRNIDMGLDRESLRALGLAPKTADLAAMRNITKFQGKLDLFEAATRHAQTVITKPLPLSRAKSMATAV
ncbi:MAG: patatin-like phospholipase family protein [Silicimonas sp.]|nr:patatin-like phospholipase family protein [Silicimonas sp.]